MSGKQFVYILVLTLATIFIWLGADFAHSRSQKAEPPADITQLLEPISPSFDQETINELGL